MMGRENSHPDSRFKYKPGMKKYNLDSSGHGRSGEGPDSPERPSGVLIVIGVSGVYHGKDGRLEEG
jgi:hypothetical protein